MKLRRIIYAVCWSLLGAGILVLLGFASAEEERLLCSEVEINILRNGENYLVEEDAIRELIRSNGDALEGMPLGSISVPRLEMLVNTNPWVESAEVYMSINGKLRIDIIQKDPLARVMNKNGETFYLDRNGHMMNWSPGFTPRVILVNGEISECFNSHFNFAFADGGKDLETTILDEVYHLVRYLDSDSLWAAQFEQIYVNAQMEFELIPRAGDHRIMMGDTSEMKQKLDKLRIFYTEGLNHTGWNQYDTIQLKFKNQIVCSKTE
ncbi:MAG: hypothetical protein IT233_02035 [Bacteroidia bacterium]|nr:hypothetical protein [Bacteroidia bacterium]